MENSEWQTGKEASGTMESAGRLMVELSEQQVERLHQQDRENRASVVYLEGAVRSLAQQVKTLEERIAALEGIANRNYDKVATLEGIANRNYDEVARLQSQLDRLVTDSKQKEG